MEFKVENTSFQEMLKHLVDLPAEIKKEAALSDRLEFVFSQSVGNFEVMEIFCAKHGIDLTLEDAPGGFKSVKLTPDQTTLFIVFVYESIYMKIRAGMIELELKHKVPAGRA